MTTNPQAAVDACKKFLTQYIGQQPHITETCGATEEQIAGVKSVMGWPATQEQIEEAMQFIPDDLVRDVCCCGTTSETIERIEAFVAAGCSEPVLTPLGQLPGHGREDCPRRSATTVDRLSGIDGESEFV